MTLKGAARPLSEPRRARKAGVEGSAKMPNPDHREDVRPVLSISSAKTLGIFATFLGVLASGFVALVFHAWDDINKHLDKIDGQLASLNVTQGKFEQFLTSQLPSITQGLQKNTQLTIKLESNLTALTRSVAKVQQQVSTAAEEIQKLKGSLPVKKGALTAPDEPIGSKLDPAAK